MNDQIIWKTIALIFHAECHGRQRWRWRRRGGRVDVRRDRRGVRLAAPAASEPHVEGRHWDDHPCHIDRVSRCLHALSTPLYVTTCPSRKEGELPHFWRRANQAQGRWCVAPHRRFSNFSPNVELILVLHILRIAHAPHQPRLEILSPIVPGDHTLGASLSVPVLPLA